MATTTFYPTSAASAATLPVAFTGTKKLLSLTRGAGVVTQTDNTIASISANFTNAQCWGAATSGADPKNGLVFVTNPLSAVVLGSVGNFGWNIRALESASTANYGVALTLYQISADGSTATIISQVQRGTELTTSEAAWAANTNYTGGASKSIADGERLVVTFLWVATGGTSASGRTASGFYNGTTAAASGDTWVTTAETVTEYVAPAATPPRTTTVVLQAVNRSAVW